MVEQLKDCLIVHAASIFTKALKVNGFGSGSALWIGKPADWIFCKKIRFSLDEKRSIWMKKDPLWSGLEQKLSCIMKFNHIVRRYKT
ncbi:hypothetical protein [Enterocloster clostridioformis]|uniref:hypothetical protein n=1 Tax=Enterocloster clostridioformis TaxID=1531 RepID=UPI0012BB6EA4|nr:hypothetical protein [Enterocloster clostridioformis]